VIGLEQQDRSCGLLAATGREDRAGWVAADDDHVSGLGQVGHGDLLGLRVVAPGGLR
jgi:hypothetical protein